jgi:hypothetical protein
MPVCRTLVDPAAIQVAKDDVQGSIKRSTALCSYQYSVVPSNALQGPLQRLATRSPALVKWAEAATVHGQHEAGDPEKTKA